MRPRTPVCGWNATPATPVILIVFGAALLTFSQVAEARIGNPLKKAKDLEKNLEQKAPASPNASTGGQAVFDDVTVELTEARVQQIVTAYQKSAEAGAGRPALVAKRDQASDDKSKLIEKEGQAIQDAQVKRDEVKGCYEHEYQQATERRSKDYAQRALSDPTLLEIRAKAAQEYNAAVQKGDSAAIANAQAAAMAGMLPTKEDTLQIRQKCGTPPPPLAAEKRLAELDKQLASLDEQIRDVDQKVAAAQAKTGGLTPQQWGIATERIQMYLEKHGGQSKSTASVSKGSDTRKKKGDSEGPSSSGSASSGSSSSSSQSSSSSTKSAHDEYTDEEVKAIEKHLGELRGYLG